MENMVARILTKHLRSAQQAEIPEHIWHPYWDMSKKKSEMV